MKAAAVEDAPVEAVSTEAAEVEEAPVEAAPSEAVAVEDAPAEAAPMEAPSAETSPAEAEPVEAPVDSAPADEAPAVDAATAATADAAVGEEAMDSAAAPVADGDGKAPPPGVPGLDWYIIHAYSGFENKVRESLRTRADAFGFGDSVGEMLIPTEEVVELRAGKRVTTKRLLYPGYVLVQLDLDDELWHVVKNTPRVTGFVGGGHKPNPLTADEVNQILYRQTASAERPRPKMSFQRNDQVKIVDGPFANFSGTVEEVNEDRATLKVMVTIFGRGTPVELEYFQVEKEG